jgi:hypothetical protein
MPCRDCLCPAARTPQVQDARSLIDVVVGNNLSVLQRNACHKLEYRVAFLQIGTGGVGGWGGYPYPQQGPHVRVPINWQGAASCN